jgi:phosphate starvation-inducible membrane PsiE
MSALHAPCQFRAETGDLADKRRRSMACMIQRGNLPVPPRRRRTSEERVATGCTNRGHGREGINVKKMDDQIKKFGNWLVDTFQLLGLFVIGGTIVWAAVHEYMQMIDQGRAGLDGILLLFIYLELGAMVGIYFKTSHLPVRFLLYIAITALTRLLAIDVKTMPDQHILAITGAIVLLVMAVVAISIVRVKFPEKEPGS